jgi:hypothetical protein
MWHSTGQPELLTKDTRRPVSPTLGHRTQHWAAGHTSKGTALTEYPLRLQKEHINDNQVRFPQNIFRIKQRLIVCDVGIPVYFVSELHDRGIPVLNTIKERQNSLTTAIKPVQNVNQN